MTLERLKALRRKLQDPAYLDTAVDGIGERFADDFKDRFPRARGLSDVEGSAPVVFVHPQCTDENGSRHTQARHGRQCPFCTEGNRENYKRWKAGK